jgi:hypothetical protein
VKVGVLLAASALLLAAVGCGGGDEEAATTASTPPTTQSGAPASRIERRLSRAGYHVVANRAAEGDLSLTTGVKRMIVFIVGFPTLKEADGYARRTTAIASRTPGQVVARRVGARIYTAVAAEEPTARAEPGPLLELITAVEGAKAKPVRLSPR